MTKSQHHPTDPGAHTVFLSDREGAQRPRQEHHPNPNPNPNFNPNLDPNSNPNPKPNPNFNPNLDPKPNLDPNLDPKPYSAIVKERNNLDKSITAEETTVEQKRSKLHTVLQKARVEEVEVHLIVPTLVLHVIVNSKLY